MKGNSIRNEMTAQRVNQQPIIRPGDGGAHEAQEQIVGACGSKCLNIKISDTLLLTLSDPHNML